MERPFFRVVSPNGEDGLSGTGVSSPDHPEKGEMPRTSSDNTVAAKGFYSREYAGTAYANLTDPEQHSHWGIVADFIREYGLSDKRCLEVGCGRGAFQNLAADYIGVDLSVSVKSVLRKRFCAASATELHFKRIRLMPSGR